MQAILSYIYTFIDLNKEEKEIKEIFLLFDKNNDGVLTKQEIIEGFQKFYKYSKPEKY